VTGTVFVQLQIVNHRFLHILALGALLGVLAAPASAQRLMMLGGGAVQLSVEPSPYGGDAFQDTDESTRILWNQTEARSKVTVSTFAPGQTYRLYAEAVRVKRGTPVGRVELRDGMHDTDLIVNIQKKKAGFANIRYIAEATIGDASSETGLSDQHTVTFTLTEQ